MFGLSLASIIFICIPLLACGLAMEVGWRFFGWVGLGFTVYIGFQGLTGGIGAEWFSDDWWKYYGVGLLGMGYTALIAFFRLIFALPDGGGSDYSSSSYGSSSSSSRSSSSGSSSRSSSSGSSGSWFPSSSGRSSSSRSRDDDDGDDESYE